MRNLPQTDLATLYLNFTAWRDKFCNGAASMGIAEFYKQFGLEAHPAFEGRHPTAADVEQLTAAIKGSFSSALEPKRRDMLTFKTAIAAYRSLLEQNPGKALRLDADNIAFMLDGYLVGFCDGEGKVDADLIYGFDSSAWDDEEGCWAGAGEQTQAAIDAPTFTDIPVV